jgi:hypothetical protein
MLETLANSERTPAFILNWLSYHEDCWVRCGIAQNPNTPPETLDRLADDKNWSVRYHAVLHKIAILQMPSAY